MRTQSGVPRWEVLFEPLAVDEVEAAGRFAGPRILDAIEKHLVTEPEVRTRNRRPLENVEPPFPHEQPVWKLRVGDWRVIYSFREDVCTVHIWSVFFKGTKTTEEAMKK